MNAVRGEASADEARICMAVEAENDNISDSKVSNDEYGHDHRFEISFELETMITT